MFDRLVRLPGAMFGKKLEMWGMSYPRQRWELITSPTSTMGNKAWALGNPEAMCFPDSSTGKEFACSSGDPGSIPGLGRSSGEGIGYPLQYSWASLVAQLVKNLPAMWETWVRSLGWEDPLKNGKATPSGIPAWKIPGLYNLWGQTWLSDFHFHWAVRAS